MTHDEIVKALKLYAGDRCCEGCIEEQSVRHWQIVMREAADMIESLQAQTKVSGETSDGYHTFNELYHHRAVLFSVICNDRPEMAWKSKLHHDGTMYDGMFIVGINTPDGQATYHYDVEPYWKMFRVPELPHAPEWDGHTPAQAIERIGKLSAQPAEPPVRCGECANYQTQNCAAKHEQALMDFCSHGIRKPGGEQDA